MPNPLFVETLTPSVLRWLWGRRRSLFQGRGCSQTIHVLYRVSSASRWLAARAGWSVREIEFDFRDDVRLADGSCATQEVFERAPGALVGILEALPAYQEAVRGALRAPSHEPYARAYLAKRIGYELGAAIRSVVVAGWYVRSRLRSPTGATLLLRASWQSDLIRGYGLQQGIRVDCCIPESEEGMGSLLSPQPTRPAGGPAGGLRMALTRVAPAFLRGLAQLRAGFAGEKPAGSALIAAEMYLNGTRTCGPYNSDLFWYRGGHFAAGDVIAYFRHPKDQPRGERVERLRREGIIPVGRTPMARWKAAGTRGRRSARSGHRPLSDLASAVERYLEDFYGEYDLWLGFCRTTGARIHVSMYKQFPENEARHAAFWDAGGLSVTLQRSVERQPHLFRRTVCDVHFGHSRAKADVEQESGSRIRQFLVAGYPFDHAFVDARREGSALKNRLHRMGARFILCYLDQNEGSHRKAMGGRDRIREDYRFLCAKLAADPELGLILKPKRPETLPNRLGSVWDSLEQFVRSGRCILLEREDPDRSTLPCVASAGADVAVNLLYGGTAGLESWLSGTRTLLLAAHGAEPGAFSRLPPGSVVFDNWPELWEAVEQLRRNPAHPAIGNWGPVIEDFANLRDGRAAERIGQQIAWLQEALRAGKNQAETLREAARRYGQAWGEGWVVEQDPQPQPREAAKGDGVALTR